MAMPQACGDLSRGRTPFDVRGRGLGKDGDLFVVTKIVVPGKLTDAQKKVWEQLAKESKFNPRD